MVAAPLAALQTLYECFSFRNLEPVRKAVSKRRCMLLPHFWRRMKEEKGAGEAAAALRQSLLLCPVPVHTHPLMHIEMSRQLHTIQHVAEDASLLTNCRDTNSMRRKPHLELRSSLTWLACDHL